MELNRRRHHNKTFRQKVASIVFGGFHPWDTIFNGVILVMIVINVILFILSTDQTIRDHAEDIFDGIEYFFVAVFTIEFGLRIWTCIEKKIYKRLGPVVGRLRFCISPYSIIDILAILPFYIQLFLPSDDRLTFITAIRMFRVFRLFKAEKYSRAISILTAVVKNNREVLLTTFVIGIILFICTSTALYLAERDSQPDIFGSIPATMYTAVMLLTGLEVPRQEILTEPGKIIVGLSAVFSVAVFAVPAGILGWGFESVGEKFQEKRKQRKKRQRKLERGQKSISTESSEGVDTEWSLHLSSDSDSNDETEPLEPTNIQEAGCCPRCQRPF